MLTSEGILSKIGNTPLIRLDRVMGGAHFNLYAKVEGLNPGGSIKDRPAVYVIEQAMKTGEVRPGTVVIESSSGNMGIGLALACCYYGLRLICVVDPKTTTQNIKLLQAYGAEVDMVLEPDPLTGEFLQARIDRVQELRDQIENSFWPNQYANVNNACAHHQTMREIVTALGCEPDYLFCTTSTCGTLRGCAEYAREHGLLTKVCAVDAVGSVIFGGVKAKRLIPGHGAAVRPRLFQTGLAQRCIHVTDLDCVVGCRRLARTEALLTGGSSGGALMAVEQVRDEIPAGSNCVVILADRGERYLDTIYSDSWVAEHFGDVTHLWEQRETVEPYLEQLEGEPCVTMAF
ncbi:MAG TPA: 2,3-diaminopropionate biosynthesis protein SbnA [Pyrinomonadaceae bacterium]